MANHDVLTNNQNAFDLTYDVSNKGSEENKNSVDESRWTTVFNRLRQIIPGGSWLLETSKRSGSSDQSPFELGTHKQDNKDLEYKLKYDTNRYLKIPEGQLTKRFQPTYDIDLKTQPILDTRQERLTFQLPTVPASHNNVSSSPQQKMIEIPILNETISQRIGLMALIKLGLTKLKAIGFIKMLFLLLFKLKVVLLLLFFKIFSLLKFIKFLILPIFVLPAIIYLMIMKTSPVLMNTIDTNNNNPDIFSTANTSILNNEEVIISPGGVIMFSGETVRIPGESTLVPSGETLIIPGETLLIPEGPTIPDQSSTLVIPNSNIPSGVIDGFNFLSEQRYKPLEVLDSNLNFFQKELNFEKCIERIACKIAVTGKTGIIPLWINW